MPTDEYVNPEHVDSGEVNDNGRIRLALDRLADAINAARVAIVAAIAAAAAGNTPSNPQ